MCPCRLLLADVWLKNGRNQACGARAIISVTKPSGVGRAPGSSSSRWAPVASSAIGICLAQAVILPRDAIASRSSAAG